MRLFLPGFYVLFNAGIQTFIDFLIEMRIASFNSLHNPSVERVVIFYPLAQFPDFCCRSVSIEVLLDEYFEIFLGRMMMCKRAAEVLEASFKLTVNGSKVL